jgi:nucleotide-binding universal stress UspA family protein
MSGFESMKLFYKLGELLYRNTDMDKIGNNTTLPSIDKILVPIDATSLSRKAANYAIHLAEVEKAKELVVLHVVEDVKGGGAIALRAKYGDVKMVEGFRKAKKDSAEQVMKPLQEEAKKRGVNMKGEIIYSQGTSVVQDITQYAKKNDVDIIVIGGGDLSKKYFIIGGSVADGVIKKSKCPVLVMR